jgi:DNA-binding winged helix-turn-helix (wHTH) protein
MRVGFGAFRFDSSRCLVTRDGSPIHLTRKAFLLLELLLESHPAVVAKGRIMDRLWPSCFVLEANLANIVSELRAALGTDGASLIQTVRGVGYVFAGEAVALTDARAASAAPRFLLVEKGPPPRSMTLGEGVTLIGRSVECDARVVSATVSRTHARIRLEEGTATLEDLGSRNGTYLRGRRLDDPSPLASGDEIRLGSVELVFLEATESESATAPLE